MKVPSFLASQRNWIVWRDVDGRKLPLASTGLSASSTNSATWTDLATAQHAAPRYSGLGYVFDGSGVVGIDIDGCIGEDMTVQPWARRILDHFDTYAEVSPSKNGVKLWLRGSYSGQGNKRPWPISLKCSTKHPAVEVYDRGRYFTFTGWRLWTYPAEVQERQAELDVFSAKVFPPREIPFYESHSSDSPDSVADCARRYVGKMDVSVQGQDGSKAAMNVAAVLVRGFNLPVNVAYLAMLEWNMRCLPPWSEKELRHKLASADKASGARGGLIPEKYRK